MFTYKVTHVPSEDIQAADYLANKARERDFDFQPYTLQYPRN